MYKITKQFHFSAGHHLNNLPKTHPCSRKHGHNYTVTVELSSYKLINGFVQDYGELKPIKNFIDNELDHRYLNDLERFYPYLEQPTAENIAKLIYVEFKEQFPFLSAVTVKETDKTSATYEPGFDEI